MWKANNKHYSKTKHESILVWSPKASPSPHSTALKVTQSLHLFQHLCEITAIDSTAWIKADHRSTDQGSSVASGGLPKQQGAHQRRGYKKINLLSPSLRSGKCMAPPAVRPNLSRSLSVKGITRNQMATLKDLWHNKLNDIWPLWWQEESLCWKGPSGVLDDVCAKTPEGSCNRLAESFAVRWNRIEASGVSEAERRRILGENMRKSAKHLKAGWRTLRILTSSTRWMWSGLTRIPPLNPQHLTITLSTSYEEVLLLTVALIILGTNKEPVASNPSRCGGS